MSKDFKKRWKWPSIDTETGLFKEKKQNKLAKLEESKKQSEKPPAGGMFGGLGKRLQNSIFTKLENIVTQKEGQ